VGLEQRRRRSGTQGGLEQRKKMGARKKLEQM